MKVELYNGLCSTRVFLVPSRSSVFKITFLFAPPGPWVLDFLNIVSRFPNAPVGAVNSMCDSVGFVGLKVSYQACNLEMKISENSNSVT